MSKKLPTKPKNKLQSSTLLILAFIMIVNALSYGTIIPLLYPYAAKFGINALGLSFLFTSFSIAQFFSTPILGRLSDRYGRKPMLTLCLMGTAASLGLFALAQSALVLFIARTIDGLTGGNISIAQAVIADSTSGQERARAYGLLGGAFGVGFLVGPALGGVLATLGLTAPFWFSAALAIVGAVAVLLVLPETLKPSVQKQDKHEPLFKFFTIFQALGKPGIGLLLLVNFLAAVALNGLILGFQTFTVDVLKLSPIQTGLFFSTFGVITVIMQVFGIKMILQRYKSKSAVLFWSLALSSVSVFALVFTKSFFSFLAGMSIFGIVSSFRDPMVSALITEETRQEDLGEALGINQSYVSLGQIFGPLLGGYVSQFSVPMIFALASGIFAVTTVASRGVMANAKKAIKADL